jgi:hypothetical protein
MPFSVGDVVQICNADAVRRGKVARIEWVLPKRLSQEDFQEYVVEFTDANPDRFKFCVYREFELRQAGGLGEIG